MDTASRRLERERRTARAMVELYCAAHHGTGELCDACRALGEYADRRLDRCPYGPAKPTCVNCPIHCYQAEPREQMRVVMRFAGPRMLRTHLVLAFFHLIDGRGAVPTPPRRTTGPA